jgi:hypothetical protein
MAADRLAIAPEYSLGRIFRRESLKAVIVRVPVHAVGPRATPRSPDSTKPMCASGDGQQRHLRSRSIVARIISMVSEIVHVGIRAFVKADREIELFAMLQRPDVAIRRQDCRITQHR